MESQPGLSSPRLSQFSSRCSPELCSQTRWLRIPDSRAVRRWVRHLDFLPSFPHLRNKDKNSILLEGGLRVNELMEVRHFEPCLLLVKCSGNTSQLFYFLPVSCFLLFFHPSLPQLFSPFFSLPLCLCLCLYLCFSLSLNPICDT